MLIYLIIFLALFLALALSRLDYALFFLIAALPAYLIRFSVFGIPSTILEAMILITFTIWFLKNWLPYFRDLIRKKTERLPYPFSWEIVSLIILSFIATGVASFSLGALGIWKAYFFEPILVFILIINLYREKKDWQKILWALLLSAISVSILAIYQKITGQFIFNDFWANEATRRVVSWFGYPNAVGLYLAPLVLLFLGWFFSLPHQTTLSKAFKKILIILTIAASLLSIYFARSEGALLGIAAGLFVFGLLAGRKQRIATFVLALVVVSGIFFFAPSRNFVFTKLTLNDLSGQIRQRQWKETLLALNGAKIITGAGLNNYQKIVAPYHQEGIFFNSDNLPNFDASLRASATLRAKYWQPVEIYLYPHNIFLNFWSEIGLLGALVFMWLIFKSIYLSLKLTITYGREKYREKYLALGLMTALVTIFVHGLVDVPYFKNDLSVMFWLFLAFIGLLNLNQKFGAKNIRN
jgi:O-antigen ligase